MDVNAEIINGIIGTTVGGATPAGNNVLVIQGDASGTAVKVGLATGSNVVGLVNTNADAAIGAGAAPAKALVVGGVYNSSKPSPTTGQTTALQLDTSGFLLVNVATDSIGIATGANTIGAVASSTFTTTISVTPTVSASTYTALFCMGGIMTFTSILPANFFGILESIRVTFKTTSQIVSGYYVSIFVSSPAGTYTDHAATVTSAADMALLLACYRLQTPLNPLNAGTIFQLDGIGKAINGTTRNLFVVVTNDTTTTVALGSTTDMIVELGVIPG